jgi:hypothetical protein
MPITISGSTGIAGVDGSASTPAVQGTDTNTGIAFPAADTVTVATGGTERMRVDSSGNVGIGTSSPSGLGKLVVAGADDASLFALSSTTGVLRSRAYNTATTGPVIEGTNAAQSAYANLFLNGLNLLLGTGGVERARIDSNGNVQINTSNAAATGTTCRFTIEDGTTYLPFGINNNAAGTGASNVALFARNGTTTGTISVTGTTTAYNTSSDYRLKHDVQPMLSGLSTIAALKPSTYKWNADNSYGEGFIAHELQAVIPQAVTGKKDAVNDDGSIKAQGVDYSKIVVHLVAAIQELKADNDAMKERIATLEAK